MVAMPIHHKKYRTGAPPHRRRLATRQDRLRFETLEPRLVLSTTPLITEFMASNDATLLDGDGNSSDWIEVHNPTAGTIDLAGWHLTDDATNLDKWTFPALPQSVLEAGEYLVVFASGQATETYVDPAGNLHTDFRLSAGGEYLGLTDLASAIVHEYAPEYPQQQQDVSYGIFPDDLPAGPAFFASPTPGAANGLAVVAEQVVFSESSRAFAETFQLTLTGTAGPEQFIVYTLDGTIPGDQSTVYTSSLTIDSTTQVRARIIEVGKEDGPVTSGNYSRLGADVLAFESQLPILLIENFGDGAVPAKGWNQTGQGIQQVARQSTAVTLFDNSTGTSSFFGDTELHTRAGIRERGAFSSTFPEPQYSLETWGELDAEAAVNVFGMAEESDFILYAPNPVFDQTLMNNQFMFEIARGTSVWSPQVQFVEAFLNTDGGDVTMNDHVGLYVWTERVKRDAGRLDFERFAEDGSAGGWLLSINRMDALPVGDPNATPQHFHTPGADGVLDTPPNSFGQGDDEPRQGNAFLNFEHPNGYDLNATQRQAIEDWMANMEDVLYDRTAVAWNDPVDGYAKYIDVENFIDYYIMHNLSKNSDGLLLSMWIYNPDPNNGGKLKFGPPWDHDLGSLEGNPNSSLLHRSDRLWYRRLFQDPAFVDQYEARWHALRHGSLSDASMNQVFDTFVAEIGDDAFIRDGVTNITNRINTAKNWLDQRAAAIDNATGGPMTVAFSADQTGGAPPLTVQFTDESDVDGASAWEWDFGDGTTSNLQNPSHTYLTSGFFDVSLTVTGDAGPLTLVSTEFVVTLVVGDVDLNGVLEEADVTQFIEHWRTTSVNLSNTEMIMLGDLNRNGVTDFADWAILRQAWQDEFGVALSFADAKAGNIQTHPQPGDYNTDGVVNAIDYALWREALGQSVTPFSSADGDGSGVVDQADYEIWRETFGQTPPAPSQSPILSQSQASSPATEAAFARVAQDDAVEVPTSAAPFILGAQPPESLAVYFGLRGSIPTQPSSGAAETSQAELNGLQVAHLDAALAYSRWLDRDAEEESIAIDPDDDGETGKGATSLASQSLAGSETRRPGSL